MSGHIGMCGGDIVCIVLGVGSGVERPSALVGTSINCEFSDAGLAGDGSLSVNIGLSDDAISTNIDCTACISGGGADSAALDIIGIVSEHCIEITMAGGEESVHIGICTQGITTTAVPDGS